MPARPSVTAKPSRSAEVLSHALEDELNNPADEKFVTVVAAEISSYTDVASCLTSAALAGLINRLDAMFGRLCDLYGAFKVASVG